MYYGYRKSSVPAAIPAGGGLAPMGGPFYDFDAELDSDAKFPQSYDGKPFFYEWADKIPHLLDAWLAAAGRRSSRRSTASCRTSRSSRRRTEVRARRRAVHRSSGAAASVATTRTPASTGSTTSTARARRSPGRHGDARHRPDAADGQLRRHRLDRPRGRRAHLRVGLRRRRHDRRRGADRDPQYTSAGRLQRPADRHRTRPARPGRRSSRSRSATRGRRSSFDAAAQRRLLRLGRPRRLGRRRSPTPRTARIDLAGPSCSRRSGTTRTRTRRSRTRGPTGIDGDRARRRPLGGHEGLLRARRALHRRRRDGTR